MDKGIIMQNMVNGKYIRNHSFLLMKNTFFVLRILNNNGSDFIGKLCKEAGITYSHLNKMEKCLEKYGLIETVPHKNKRIKMIRLTSKGKEIFDNLNFVYENAEKNACKIKDKKLNSQSSKTKKSNE